MSRRFVFSRIENSGIEFTKYQKRGMTASLPSKIYWIQPNRLRLWNIELIRDLYLNHAGDRNAPAHQLLVKEFLSTLPKAP